MFGSKIKNDVDEYKDIKEDIDTSETDSSILVNMDEMENGLDELESVAGELGNDTVQNILEENPQLDLEAEEMHNALEQIKNGEVPEQVGAVTADQVQPPQQEERYSDLEEMHTIEKSQKAKSSKRFKAVKNEYKTIGVGGWFARVLGHAVFGVLTAAQTLANLTKRFAGAATRKFIRWKNGTPKLKTEERGISEGAGMERNPADESSELQEKPLTPMEEIERGDDDQEILDRYDQRPMIWEKRISENPKQKPYVTVDINMNNGKEEGTNDLLSSSHASLALNYTRLNRRSGKTERCRIKMGYYMGAGTGDRSLAIAMLGSGSFISGRLLNDSYLSTTIGKRYDATNKQINHILEQSSHYEEGGYHNLKRNCTTFVAEMTQQAGLPTGDMLQKKDLDLGAGWFIVPLIPVISPIAKAIGQKTVNKLANRDDMSYFGMGKKMMSKEISQKYSNANDNLMRFNTFSPTATAERMRNGGMTMLHSTSYRGMGDNFDSRFNTEKYKLKAAILKVTGPDYEDDVETLMEKLGENQQALIDKMRASDLEEDIPKKNQILTEIVDDLQGRRKYLSEWFYSVIDGDRRLILPFNHMASVLECEEQIKNNAHRDYGVDSSRDTAYSIAALNSVAEIGYSEPQWNENADSKSVRLLNSYYMGLIRVFGSLQAGLDAKAKLAALQSQGKDDPALRRKMGSVETAQEALRYDEVRKGMTQADADFAFQEMPEKVRGNRIEGAEHLAGIYQSLAYEKVFGGTKLWLEKEAEQNTFTETLLKEDLTGYLMDKMKGTGKESFRMILKSIKASHGDSVNDEEVYSSFIRTFTDHYLEQVLYQALDPQNLDIEARIDILTYLDSLKEGGSMKNSDEFKAYVLSVIAKI